MAIRRDKYFALKVKNKIATHMNSNEHKMVCIGGGIVKF